MTSDDNATVVCSQCGHAVSAKARFCRRCGNTVRGETPSICSRCGALTNADDHFCAKCGTEISATASPAKARSYATVTRRSRYATAEPLPLSSLPEKPSGRRNWFLGFIILFVLSAMALGYHDKRAAMIQSLGGSAPQATGEEVLSNPTEDAVRRYYDAVKAHDFAAAYSLWSPSMRNGLTVADLANQFNARV